MRHLLLLILVNLTICQFNHAETIETILKENVKQDDDAPQYAILQVATLCDFAADYNGKLVVSGTFDTVTATALPAVHENCSLAMRFCYTPDNAGQHKLSINIINEDGKSLDPVNMPIEAKFDIKIQKNLPFLTRNIVMNLKGLSFPKAGIYSIDIACDGKILARLPLSVVYNKPTKK